MIINPYAFAVVAGSAHVITGQTLGTLQNAAGAGVYAAGFRFTVGAATITVTDLGMYKMSGDTGANTLYLFDDAGNILSGSTLSNDQSLAADADGYIYTVLGTPIVLSAATTYRISCLFNTVALNHYYDDNTTVTSTTDITVDNSCYIIPGTPASRGTNAGAGHSYGPCNFKYHL